MKLPSSKFLFTGIILLFSYLHLNAQNTITLDHLEDHVWLSNPKFSPDGEKIIFTKRTADFDDNKYKSSLYLYTKKSKKLQQLTFDRTSVRSLNWSPDGNYITFLAPSNNKTTQLFKMAASGGEAQQITNHETSIITYTLAPNGNTIAFMARDKKEEKTGRNRHLKSFKVGYDWYLAREASRPIHLWILNLNNNQETQLTTGEESYSTVSGGINWSPDSNKIIYATQPKPHSSEYLKSKLNVVDVATKKVTVVDDTKRVPRNPRFAKNGTIIYSKSQGEEFYFTPNGIYTADKNGTASSKILLNIDRDIRHNYLFSDDKLLVGGPDGTKVSLWQGDLKGKYQKLDLKDVIPSASSVSISSKDEIVFVGTTSQSAPELYYMKNYKSIPEKLTNFNAKISNLKLGRTESINWTSTDSNKYYEDGVLIYPPNYEKGKKYPLVLNIHGGPMGYSTESFNFSGQNFAAQGWIVFQPNYRGSSNLGFEYQRSVINDAGEGPGKDVMAGIEKIKTMNIIDEDNIAVSGWSYGGYMTVWLTSHYQGWKSAVAGAAVTDWFDWYTMADWNVWSGKGLGGSPWLNNNAENYRKQSPITYAHQIKTPTLILSTTLDPRVTVSQSFKLFSNLKDNGVKTEFIAYPMPGHFPGDPIHRKDVYERWTNWIKKHFD